MKKITEASSMKELGVSPKDIRKLYKHSLMAVDHDLKFEPITTKGQASSKMKNGHLLVAINSVTDEVAMVYSKTKRYGAGSYYFITKPSGEQQVSSLKDVLVNLPGKGWKYYASTGYYSPSRQGEHQDEVDVRKPADYKVRSKFKEDLERIYGKKLKAEASQYASEIKEKLIQFASSDTETRRKEDKRYVQPGDWQRFSSDMDPDAVHMARLRKAVWAMNEISASDTPFDRATRVVGHNGIQRAIQNHVTNAPKEYGYSKDDKGGDLYMRNAKLGLQKTAQLVIKLLRRYRDEVIEAPKDQRLEPKKPSLGRIYKAWESYKQTGEVNILSETDDNCTLCKGEGFDPRPKTYGDICPKCSLDEIPDSVKNAAPYKECDYCKNWEDGFDPRPKTYGNLCPKCGDEPDPNLWIR